MKVLRNRTYQGTSKGHTLFSAAVIFVSLVAGVFCQQIYKLHQELTQANLCYELVDQAVGEFIKADTQMRQFLLNPGNQNGVAAHRLSTQRGTSFLVRAKTYATTRELRSLLGQLQETPKPMTSFEELLDRLVKSRDYTAATSLYYKLYSPAYATKLELVANAKDLAIAEAQLLRNTFDNLLFRRGKALGLALISMLLLSALLAGRIKDRELGLSMERPSVDDAIPNEEKENSLADTSGETSSPDESVPAATTTTQPATAQTNTTEPLAAHVTRGLSALIAASNGAAQASRNVSHAAASLVQILKHPDLQKAPNNLVEKTQAIPSSTDSVEEKPENIISLEQQVKQDGEPAWAQQSVESSVAVEENTDNPALVETEAAKDESQTGSNQDDYETEEVHDDSELKIA